MFSLHRFLPALLLTLLLNEVSHAQEAATETRTGEEEILAKPTTNPTGLQVGLNPKESGKLPKGTEELAKAGALASADLDWPTAKKAYTDMLKLAPDNALALSNLGTVEYRLGNVAEAEKLLTKATQINPAIAQNWMTLGLIYRKKGQTHLAVSALSRALHEEPGDPRIHNLLGVTIRDLGWILGAETELQRALLLDPTYGSAHYNLAVMYLDRSPPLIELARRHYYAAIDYGEEPSVRIEERLNPKPNKPKDGPDEVSKTP
tara:strand:- start:1611 stop:2396 length:786 start_codon:yes stop_codon:yes gene_type:complete